MTMKRPNVRIFTSKSSPRVLFLLTQNLKPTLPKKNLNLPTQIGIGSLANWPKKNLWNGEACEEYCFWRKGLDRHKVQTDRNRSALLTRLHRFPYTSPQYRSESVSSPYKDSIDFHIHLPRSNLSAGSGRSSWHAI